MNSVKIGWVLGAVSALGLGMAAQACSSSSTTGGDAGPTGTSSSHSSSGASNSSGSGASGTSGCPSSSSASSSSSRTNPDGGKCYAAPKELHPEDGGSGVYCPFSSSCATGGDDISCPKGQHCCVPAESAMEVSTCEPASTACASTAVNWICEGTPDCAGNANGTLCCGQGTIEPQPAQPGCGPDASTIPEYPYVSEFYGTQCQTSCATFAGTDAGPAFQVCSKSSECTVAGQTCIAIEPKGNGIGYCGVSMTGSSSSSSTTTSSSGTSDAGTSSSSGSGSSSAASSGSATSASSSSTAG